MTQFDPERQPDNNSVSIQMELFALLWGILGGLFFIIYCMVKSLFFEVPAFLFWLIGTRYLWGSIKKSIDSTRRQ